MKEKYFTVSKNISRWKLDNKFENFLGSLADNHILWKKLYVLYYKIFDNKYYNGGVKLAKLEIDSQKVLYQEAKKNYTDKELILDMIYSLHRFGASYNEYFMYRFFDKNAIGRSKFNTLKLQYGYTDLVNDANIRTLFENKYSLYKVLGKYFKREMVYIQSKEDIDILTTFIQRHSSFIYKPLLGAQGKGIQFFYNYNESPLDFYNSVIDNGAFVLEELIEQAEEINVLHKESVNTLRLCTFVIGKEVHIIGSALRMGVGKSQIDNADSGGVYATVDLATGVVNSLACDVRGTRYYAHPDTHVVLPGFKVPEFEAAKALIRSVAMEIKGATLISWDLAYSTKGWVVVEGNDTGDYHLLQNPLQIGVKDKLVTLIDDFFETKQMS